MSAPSLTDDERTGSMDPASLGLVMEEMVVHLEAEALWQKDISFQTVDPTAEKSALCRVCSEQSDELTAIFEGEGIELELEKKIHWHLPITVSRDDKLPVMLCASCIERLNACHDLANLCLDAETKLDAILNPVNTKATRANTRTSKSSRRRAFPSDQLMKAMDLLRQEKISKRAEESSEEEVDDGQDNGTADMYEAIYLEDQAINEYKDDQILDVIIEPVGQESLPPGKWTSANLRVKMPKNFAECDTTLKSQIVGAIQDIMIEEDQVKISKRKNTSVKLSKKEWKCDICGHIAPRQSSLLVHQRRTHSKPFACSYCYKTFTNGVARQSHERSHKMAEVDVSSIKVEEEEEEMQNVYVCEHCDQSFYESKSLIEHLVSNHTEPKPYKCNKCNKSYANFIGLDVHKATHSSELPFLCDTCGKKFKHKSNLRSHKRSHLNIDKKNCQVCDVCGNRFRSQFHLNEHRNIHENRKPYACDTCDKRFHKKIQLRQHASTHSGVQPFRCPICGIRFNRRGNMTQHLKRHDRPVKYTCKVCSQGYDTLGLLLQHRKCHTREELDNAVRKQVAASDDADLDAYKCHICFKLLAKKESLVLHLRSHTGEKLFTCEVCGKKLSNRGSLTYHMRSYHTGERPYACQYCSDVFLTREAMHVHERIHTGEKPYECGICNMGFRCSSNLSQHVKVHSNNRPFQCPHCHKNFLRKGALTVHLRVHTGERPYICDQCGRGFTQKNDMLKHRRTHTLEKPYSCEECGLMFAQKRELAKHHILHLDPMALDAMVEPNTVVITTTDDQIIHTFRTEVIDDPQSLMNALNF